MEGRVLIIAGRGQEINVMMMMMMMMIYYGE
jgi:hypothetical protein